MDCIFCGIIGGKIPSYKIYENEKCMAFLDINPRSMGDALLIPKKHYSGLHDMPDEEVGSIFVAAKILAGIMMERLGATGFNIFINNGKSAGQIITHTHIHIMPRYGSDGMSVEAAFPVREELRKRLAETAMLLKQ